MALTDQGAMGGSVTFYCLPIESKATHSLSIGIQHVSSSERRIARQNDHINTQLVDTGPTLLPRRRITDTLAASRS